MDKILNYIQTLFPGENLETVNVYGPVAIPCWEPCRDVSPFVTTNTTNNRLVFDKTQPRNPYNNIPVDTTKVAIRTWLLRHAVNNCDSDVFLRTNYIHPIYKTESEERAKLFNRMTGTTAGGSFVTIPGKFNGSINKYALKWDESTLPLNPVFIKMMMHINTDNVLNGIQTISPELCALGGLDKLTLGKEAQCYYAVPPDHILAWTLDVPEYVLEQNEVYARELTAGNRLLYYLIPDWCFMKLYVKLTRPGGWVDIVDLVSIHDLAVEFIPKNPLKVNSSTVELQMSITYTCSPPIPTNVLENMAPVIHPEFPTYRDISTKAFEEKDYQQMLKEQTAKMGKETKLKPVE